jgi:DNA-binding response OmpR family regulator
MNASNSLRLVHGNYRDSRTRNSPEQTYTAPARPPVAVVLSTGGEHSAEFLPVLASLGITAVDRPFDPDAARIVAAIQPELTIAICDPTQDDGLAMIAAAVAAHPGGRLLVMDTGRTVTGTIVALELGADAGLSVFEDARVVRATVTALLRRVQVNPWPNPPAAELAQLRLGNLVVDRDACEVREGDELVPLTRTEFQILAYLAGEVGKVRSPGQIMSAIHDYTYTDAEAQQAVKVYVRRIRRKLSCCSRQSIAIVNARSFGYRVEVVAAREVAATAA